MKSLDAMNEEEIRMFVKNLNTQMNLYMKQEQKNKVKSYKYLNQCAQRGQILFTGSSLMEQFPIKIRVSKDTLINICFCLYLENLTRIELGFALELFDSDSTDEGVISFVSLRFYFPMISSIGYCQNFQYIQGFVGSAHTRPPE